MSDKYLRSEQQNLINSIGTELCWGWSPALNFVEMVPKEALLRFFKPTQTTGEGSESSIASASPATPAVAPIVDELDALLLGGASSNAQRFGVSGASTRRGASPNDLHVLLCGSCDIRHVFRTLSAIKVLLVKQGQPSTDDGGVQLKPTVHFYLYESNLRVQARHIFLLQWLADSIFSFDKLEDQVSMFLEVFGNTLLRDITAAQMKDVALRALRAIGYEDGALGPRLNFSDMKAKERDFIEDQIKHWTKDTSVAPIEAQWSNRLRTEMAERYDNKDNIIDWDYNFHLYEYTNAIKFPEYRSWRNTGIAFDYCHVNPRRGFQYEYKAANKTLCHFDRKGRGVFCGDIKNGPFYTIGIDTRNEYLHPRNADGTLKYGNGVTAMHNVRAWLYELMCGKEWPWSDHKFAWDDAANYNFLPEGTPSDVEHRAELPECQFHLIGLDFERFLLHHREENRPKFHAAFVGTNCTHLLTPDFFDRMDDSGSVVCETAKFIIDCKDEAKARYEEKIMEYSSRSGWQLDADATKFVHRDQPQPRKIETTLSDAQKRSLARYKSSFVVVLKKPASAGAAAVAA